MTELRWILLGLGLLFCLGLWWWESRRGRQATNANADLRSPDRFASLAAGARDLPRRHEPEVPVLEREPLRSESIDLVEAQLRTQAEPEIPPRPRFAIPQDDTPTIPGIDIGRQEPTVHHFEGPTTRLFDRGEHVERTLEPSEPAVAPDAQPHDSPAPAADRIVTIRVSSPPLERFEGAALVRALGEVGLEHGRFSIFHRSGANGQTVFSVASLVEPGTFDLDAIEGRRFPGVSFFAVLNRPAEALEVFDEMMNTAREFAHQMHGVLQDEKGLPLSLQRLTTLRDGVVAWQKAAMRSTAS